MENGDFHLPSRAYYANIARMKTLAATFFILMVVLVVAQTSRWRQGVRDEAQRVVEAHEQDLAALRERFEGYWSRYELLESTLAETSNALAQATSERAAERSANDPLRRQIESLSAARLAQAAEEAALRTRLAEAEAQGAALRAEIATATEQEAALRARLATAEGQVELLTGALAEARDRVRSEAERRAASEAQLQSTEEELRSSDAEQQRLAQELTALQRNVAQAEAALRELQEQRRPQAAPAGDSAAASPGAAPAASVEAP